MRGTKKRVLHCKDGGENGRGKSRKCGEWGSSVGRRSAESRGPSAKGRTGDGRVRRGCRDRTRKDPGFLWTEVKV